MLNTLHSWAEKTIILPFFTTHNPKPLKHSKCLDLQSGWAQSIVEYPASLSPCTPGGVQKRCHHQQGPDSSVLPQWHILLHAREEEQPPWPAQLITRTLEVNNRDLRTCWNGAEGGQAANSPIADPSRSICGTSGNELPRNAGLKWIIIFPRFKKSVHWAHCACWAPVPSSLAGSCPQQLAAGK